MTFRIVISTPRECGLMVHRPLVITGDQMMHGEHWRDQDVRGWCVSEKLDGCRLYWDGRCGWSRSGRKVPLPDLWHRSLPRMALEGEVWAGRGKWEATVAAVAHNICAPLVCFIVFDAPAVAGPWPKRIAAAARRLKGKTFASVIPCETVRDMRHLAQMFRHVGRAGGEGLMLRCPKTEGYRAGRCSAVLKLTRDPVDGRIYPGRIEVERRMKMERRTA